MSDAKIEMVLEPEDEYPHEPDDSPNYNESMYLNAFDLAREVGVRNRRTSPDGDQLTARITEAMTRYHCNGLTGVGMSEYLDQVVDGWPTGPDLPTREVSS